jgi:hypothetical protein
MRRLWQGQPCRRGVVGAAVAARHAGARIVVTGSGAPLGMLNQPALRTL